MLRSMLSLSGGRGVIAAGLTAMTLATAACSDDATGPVAPTPNSPNAVLSGAVRPEVRTWVTVRIADYHAQTVPELAGVWFVSAEFDSTLVHDNDSYDKDPAIGYFKVPLRVSNSYEVCVRGYTKHFTSYHTTPYQPICKTGVANGQTLIQIGSLYMRRKPQLRVRMTDAWNNLLPGGSIKVYDTPTTWNFTIEDGTTFDDLMVNDGRITVNLPHPGFYTFGEVKRPTGQWEVLGAQWQGIPAQWEGVYYEQIVHGLYTK